ncbi:hypothetical protein CIK05_00605 [Bdellovibrio sp. qaytius]|nr:hypothetical protein CIK05_00605 [Bdellovibrio sp. qaytius]
MEEFKFVLKCFLISCVIVIFSQTRISGETLENKAFVFLQHSETAQWVRDAADGGIRMIRQGTEITKNFVNDKLGHGGSSTSRTIVIHRAAPSTEEETPNTGLFRKLERNPAQNSVQHAERKMTQQGGTAESEVNSKNNVDDQY